MLRILTSTSELNTDQLMSVYLETNRANGKVFYPDLKDNEQLKKAENAFLSYLRESFFRQPGAFYAVWIEGGDYSSALRLEPYKDGYLLTALETVSEFRRKGIAFCLITEALAFLRSKGVKKVYSHVGKRNVASLGVHSKCSFQRISESATYIDGTVTQNSCTLCCYL